MGYKLSKQLFKPIKSVWVW